MDVKAAYDIASLVKSGVGAVKAGMINETRVTLAELKKAAGGSEYLAAENAKVGTSLSKEIDRAHIPVGDEGYAGVSGLDNGGILHPLAPNRRLFNDPEEMDFFLSAGKKDWSFYRQLESSKGTIEVKSKIYSVDEDRASLLIDDVHVFPLNSEK
ncbi:hypothetical protein [Janthinobacterium lividum]|uniref:hypothetical protein n=1 Tax=Janthinobacterium lividum TaxID=29581 RepID=UPI000FE27B74|nr:hypothetical protein [Janthinobacterium lividum]